MALSRSVAWTIQSSSASIRLSPHMIISAPATSTVVTTNGRSSLRSFPGTTSLQVRQLCGGVPSLGLENSGDTGRLRSISDGLVFEEPLCIGGGVAVDTGFADVSDVWFAFICSGFCFICFLAAVKILMETHARDSALGRDAFTSGRPRPIPHIRSGALSNHRR